MLDAPTSQALVFLAACSALVIAAEKRGLFARGAAIARRASSFVARKLSRAKVAN